MMLKFDDQIGHKEMISPQWKMAFLVIVVLIGAFFRLYQIQQIPPGDGFDPAYYGLDALRILDGERPVYLATNFGREVLFSYLVAIVYAIVGSGAFGIHLASAFISILTIPVVFLVAEEFFITQSSRLMRSFGGGLAGLITAVSFWHLIWSRYSVRATLIPFFAALLSFFLLRALRLRRRRYFFLTGVVLGMSFYTYQLAQLFPILVLLGFLIDLVSRRSVSKKDIGHLFLIFSTALLLALPLLNYILANPDVFNQRIRDVYILKDTSGLSEQIDILAESAWQVVQLYVVKGDSDPLINFQERPLFDPFLAIFFVCGVLIAIYRWRRPQNLYIVTWLAVMSAPAMLATKAALSKRSLGALPAASLLISFAMLTIMSKLADRKHRTGSVTAVAVVLVMVLGIFYTGQNTFRDYFLNWGRDPDLVYHYNTGVAAIGKYAAELPATERVYLSPTWIDHSVLKLHSNNREDMRGYNGRHCFLYPQQTEVDTTYIIVRGVDHISLPLLEQYFPQGQLRYEGVLQNGSTYFKAYQIPAGTTAQFQPERPLTASWDNQIGLLGYDIGASKFNAGDSIPINLYLRPLADMARDYTVFIHLIGPENPQTGSPLWSQVDREPCFQSYPTSWWQPDEIMRDTFELPIASDTPPGNYSLSIGFYWWPDSTRLIVTDSTNEVAADAVILQEIQIEDATPQ
jgi:hypothetical protein